MPRHASRARAAARIAKSGDAGLRRLLVHLHPRSLRTRTGVAATRGQGHVTPARGRGSRRLAVLRRALEPTPWPAALAGGGAAGGESGEQEGRPRARTRPRVMPNTGDCDRRLSHEDVRQLAARLHRAHCVAHQRVRTDITSGSQRPGGAPYSWPPPERPRRRYDAARGDPGSGLDAPVLAALDGAAVAETLHAGHTVGRQCGSSCGASSRRPAHSWRSSDYSYHAFITAARGS